MARVEKNPFFFRGKVGNNIYRVVNGKLVVCALPKKYRISRTKAAVKGREKFAFFVKLSRAIAGNYVLDLFWKSLKLPGASSYHKIMKCSSHEIKDYDLSGFDIVKSDDHFEVLPTEINLSGTVLDVVTEPLTSAQFISVLKNPLISAQGFIFLYNPNYKRKTKFVFLPLTSADLETNLDTQLSFRFRFSKAEVKQMSFYPEKKLLINLVLKDPSGKPARCSNTIFHSF